MLGIFNFVFLLDYVREEYKFVCFGIRVRVWGGGESCFFVVFDEVFRERRVGG